MALDFLILYEHIGREYESISLLKLELEKRGYTAEIMQLLDRKKLKYFTYKKPKVVVASAMYDNKTMNSFVYNNVGICNKVVNLHWEQVLSEEQENSPFFNCLESASYALHTCWGEKARDRIVKFGVPIENTVITGPIHMDFLRDEYKGYYKSKEEICKEYNLDENKQMVLYVSSFSTAYMSDEEIKSLNELAGVGFDQFRITSQKSMHITLDWVDKFLKTKEGENTEFIYRRHPTEWNSPILNEMAKKHKNFHLISDYSVKQWITVSDTILSWMSTAIAEIYFAKKNCHIIRPIDIEWEYDPVIYENGEFISDYEGFLKAMKEENNKFPLDEKLMLSHYDFQKTPSYIRMVDALEKTLNEEEVRKPFDHFTPKFSLLKFVALIGVHTLYALKINPAKFKFLGKAGELAGRIYGHIKNTRVSKEEDNKYQEKIKKYIIK